MVHILLVILKIIGIILAVIICLVGLLLFVPFSYDGFVEVQNKNATGFFNIKWIAIIILFRIYEEKKEVLYVLKVFGIPFLKGNLTGEDENKEKSPKDKKNNVDEDEEELVEEDDDDVFEALLRVLKDDSPIHNNDKQPYNDSTSSEEPGESKLDEIKKAIKNFVEKIKALPQKYRELKENINTLKKRAKRLRKILKSKRFKYAFAYSKEILIKLYNHIKPTKLEADFVFGFEEPDMTGKALAVLAVICGTIDVDADKIKIVPDFTEKRFEGKGKIEGKFLLAIVLASAIKIYFKKEVRDVVNGIKRV